MSFSVPPPGPAVNSWLARAKILWLTDAISSTKATESWGSDRELWLVGSSCREGEGGDHDTPVNLGPSAWGPTACSRERPVRELPFCPAKPPRPRAANQLGRRVGTWEEEEEEKRFEIRRLPIRIRWSLITLYKGWLISPWHLHICTI